MGINLWLQIKEIIKADGTGLTSDNIIWRRLRKFSTSYPEPMIQNNEPDQLIFPYLPIEPTHPAWSSAREGGGDYMGPQGNFSAEELKKKAKKKKGKEPKYRVELKTGQKFRYKKDALRFIKEKIMTNYKWLKISMRAIWGLQERDEQECGDTIYKNGAGFSSYDAPVIKTYLSIILQKRCLNGRQLRIAKGIMVKYRKQLLELGSK